MKKIRTVWLAFGAVVVVLTGCAGIGQHDYRFSDGLKGAIADSQPTAVILVLPNGDLRVVKPDGKAADRCVITSPVTDKLPKCRGLERGAEVQQISNMTVIKSNINPDCYTFYDSRGVPYQVCW